ncbi:nitrate/sulfonate/bicarbonate ABC transporter ATP-binding protein [Leucobacter albus]|uniref:Nitrate/sulfonate/bicarbonate ABC transporter ATP-binding protein n=1 Tax=Leucobacter albus TaxID=272210 RepID=A0ABW3TLW8_9MICO
MTKVYSTQPPGRVLASVEQIAQIFPSADGGTLQVLDGVNLTIREGEIVALLGRSGSGKSTLLRILAGLLQPSSGEVRYRGVPVAEAEPAVAMVFQSFALMPWLTVLENVELGLRAAAVPRAERRARALAAIDAIGLDGFETAYPRELSGGMAQRVGFARAFVQRPDLLLMDEPFSALDVLTGENLRSELMAVWGERELADQSICIVTHSIEEAVQLADRVLVLGGSPGTIQAELPIHIPRPRDKRSPTFEAAVDKLYALLTGRPAGAPGAHTPLPGPLTHPLPEATSGGLAGLVEIVVAHGGQTDLPDLADELSFDIDALLPLVDAASMLGLLEVDGAQSFITDAGHAWHWAGIQESKASFAHLAVTRAPLVRTIVKALENSDTGTLRADFFRDLLRRGFNEADAERQLTLAIDWGRYGELFDYDADTDEVMLSEVASGLASLLEPGEGTDIGEGTGTGEATEQKPPEAP